MMFAALTCLILLTLGVAEGIPDDACVAMSSEEAASTAGRLLQTRALQASLEQMELLPFTVPHSLATTNVEPTFWDQNAHCTDGRGYCVEAQPGKPVYFFLHVAKAAGGSFDFDVLENKRVLPPGSGYFTQEMCLMDMVHTSGYPGTIVSIFREPAAQVQSLYYHCSESDDSRRIHTENQQRPEFATIEAWLAHFAADPNADEFGCANPRNFITRLLTCQGTHPWFRMFGVNHELYHLAPDDASNLAEAKDHLEYLTTVGITDTYQASLCLIISKLGNPLPAGCNCEDPVAWAAFNPPVKEHGTTVKHGVKDLSQEALSLIAKLTDKDVVLYNIALARFNADIREAEVLHGVKILCPKP
ncbi:unnamed protein product [Polarella glacialis]|uniref:Uncharacterized protein n=1 Tax=Polarella glacialis TaxID=89957 RepID=A0A813I110_POLGL|nr:unnamed protein product [Polarella glacialis]